MGGGKRGCCLHGPRWVGLALTLLAFAACSGSAPSPSEVAWSAVPLQPDDRLTVIARSLCFDAFTEREFQGLPLMIQDRRLPEAAAFTFSSRPTTVECFIHREDAGAFEVSGNAAFGDDRGFGELMPPGWANGPGVKVLRGDAPPDARRIVITIPAGTEVEASVADRRYVAWYPGWDLPTRIVAYNAIGLEIGRLEGPEIDGP